MNEQWGTFALGEQLSTRRNQQLGLGAAIRHYNEMSVPGIGGIGFCMPLIWSLIGIKIASEMDGLPAIRAANAIEAKVMLDAIRRGNESNRILGRQKLPRQDIGEGSFKRMARANTYVTQPYQQACAQPLMEFGLVASNSARFNSFALTERGEAFLSPFEKPIRNLKSWAQGRAVKGDFTSKITPDLKAQWRELFDSEPPPFNRRYLESRLAYRIQELAYGGLKPETVRRLERLGEELDGGNRKKSRIRADMMPIVGTRLIREWQEIEHVVTVTTDGFDWQGRPYTSLSAIARAITGTRWNGWVFFGLKNHRRGA